MWAMWNGSNVDASNIKVPVDGRITMLVCIMSKNGASVCVLLKAVVRGETREISIEIFIGFWVKAAGVLELISLSSKL